jgi:hypothetical protein
LQIPGNIAPEAFSSDRKALFVIEYLPPLKPDRYRVRRLDLASGRVGGVFSVDGHLQQAMRGTARTQAMSADGQRLYTMYWLGEPAGGGRAFVHVLDLDEQWAHCIDLPRPLGSPGEDANALALSADGSRLYVVDADAGSLAEIDTRELRTLRTSAIDMRGNSAPRLAAATGPTLYLGRDDRLVAIDRGTLAARDRWTMPGSVSGIQPAAADDRLFVAIGDRIIVLDRTNGRALRELTVEGLDEIDQLGLTGARPGSVRSQIKCAC